MEPVACDACDCGQPYRREDLTRAEVAAYAASHGLEDPHVIAERLNVAGSLRAERDRASVRKLFASDPLPVTMAKVPPFPIHALPSVLGDMATGLARELGIDPAMAAVFGLGAISGALCGRVVVQVHGHWIENGVSSREHATSARCVDKMFT